MPTSCPWSLSALRVPPAQRPRLFDAFAHAAGGGWSDQLEAAYGGVWPPPHLLQPAQSVWRFTHNGALVGWGALTAEPSEQATWISLGVWPDVQRRGVRVVIRNMLTAFAQAQGVSQIRIGVLLTNTPHLRRCLTEASAGGEWRHAGMVWWPEPGYAIFARGVA